MKNSSFTVQAFEGVTLTAYYSDIDQALVVEIDTTFEPNRVGVRIWLNDEQHILALKDRS